MITYVSAFGVSFFRIHWGYSTIKQFMTRATGTNSTSHFISERIFCFRDTKCTKMFVLIWLFVQRIGNARKCSFLFDYPFYENELHENTHPYIECSWFQYERHEKIHFYLPFHDEKRVHVMFTFIINDD
jgi:hypothetical protein